MNHTKDDMTLAEILGDPLIGAVMRADGIALNDFKELMHSAARSLKTRDGTPLGGKVRTNGLAALSKRTLVATMQPVFVGSFEPCSANM
jgi:hypothetical protein